MVKGGGFIAIVALLQWLIIHGVDCKMISAENMQYLIAVMATLIGFFLRDLHNRIRILEAQAVSDQRDIALIKQELGQGYRHLTELINQKFDDQQRRLEVMESTLTQWVNSKPKD